MHRILTFFIALHWTVHFALLAGWSAGASKGMPAVFEWLGVAHVGGAQLAVDATAATALALGFGLAAVLFFWMLVTVTFDLRALTGDADHVARLAFAVAAGVATLVLLAGAALPLSGLMPAVSIQVAALLASYVAICAERSTLAGSGEAGETGASLMALDAAHSSLLSRLSGRSGAEEGL